MSPVILVGRRPDGGHRDRLWAHCDAWWRREVGWPISIGYHLADEGPWSLAAASNRAAANAGHTWDVAVYTGADVVPGSVDQVTAAVDLSVSTGQLVFAHDHYIGLGAEGTERVLAGEPPTIEFAEWPEQPSWPNTFSSLLVVPRLLWESIGGFDERFVGPWGGEDLAFFAACWAFGGGFERVPGPIYHLHHERDPAQREQHPNYPAADELMRRYLDAKWTLEAMLPILTEPGAPLAPR